ncbi:uncharacterized membrane protein-like protein [Tanacetum coccineum]
MSIFLGILGVVLDFPVITVISVLKSPYMLLKGLHHLFQDCVGREGPFLETICVPFAGLAILLWPLAVAGAIIASMLSGIAIGLCATMIVYQESSFYLRLCYIVAALSIYDEYSNDIIDMPKGSCFPKFLNLRSVAFTKSAKVRIKAYLGASTPVLSKELRTLHKEIHTVNLIVGADPTIRLWRKSKDTVQLETAVSTISHESLREFTSEYGISEGLHPELPGRGDMIVDFPEGKSLSNSLVTTFSNRRSQEMDLFNLISAPNPAAVKTGTRPRAAHEVPLLTTTASRVIDMEDVVATSTSSGTPLHMGEGKEGKDDP